MARHTWKVDLTGDFDANEAEAEAWWAGLEAIEELCAVYHKKLQAFYAMGHQVEQVMRDALVEGHAKGHSRDRIHTLAQAAKSDQLAKAASELPRKNFEPKDFEALPIWRPDIKKEIPKGACRINNGGVWTVLGATPFLCFSFMMYRAHVRGRGRALN
jgi:hypothetical protein